MTLAEATTPTSPPETACRLCKKETNEVGPLRASHIIPRFITKLSKQNGKSLHFKTRQGIRLGQDDWKEHLLCDDCEQLLSEKHESVIKALLFSGKKRPSVDGPLPGARPRGSNDKLALALLSIFWRAIVAEREEYQQVHAPEYIESSLRKWICECRIPPDWDQLVSIKIQELCLHNGLVMPVVVNPFYRKVLSQERFEFVFIFGGYCITIGIPPSAEAFPRNQSLRSKSESIRVKRIDCADVPELKHMLKEMVAWADRHGDKF
jgi:hypothetical protein